jgi:hypothetical protein
VYSVKHKLKNCDMMKNFTTLGTLTRGSKLEEDPGGSDMTPFPGKDAVMMVYDGCHVSILSPRTPTRCGWGHGDTWE